MTMSAIENALTIDVEDYFQVAALAEAVRREDWHSMEYRVEANTQRILSLLDRHKARATFFTLGWVAEKSPELVREIQKAGHEVASHGYSHQLIYNQTPEVFREETRRSKQILEDIIGEPVTGYRAASYSITNQSRRGRIYLGLLHFPGAPRPLRHAGCAALAPPPENRQRP